MPSPAEIQERINELVDRGLLERRLGSDGEWEYRRTPLGTQVLGSIASSDEGQSAGPAEER